MGTCSDKYDILLCSYIDEQPIWFNMTLARAFILTNKLVILKMWFQVLSANQFFDDCLKLSEIFAAPLHSLDIFFELRSAADRSH